MYPKMDKWKIKMMMMMMMMKTKMMKSWAESSYDLILFIFFT